MLGLSFHSPGLKDNFCNHPVSKSKNSGKIDKEVKSRHNIILNGKTGPQIEQSLITFCDNDISNLVQHLKTLKKWTILLICNLI